MTELAGRLLLDGQLVAGRLGLADGRIAFVEPDAAVQETRIVAPGAIDLHVHGFGGADPTQDLAGAARALARVGTTAIAICSPA